MGTKSNSKTAASRVVAPRPRSNSKSSSPSCPISLLLENPPGSLLGPIASNILPVLKITPSVIPTLEFVELNVPLLGVAPVN